MSGPRIPQTDPGAGYRARKADIDAAVARALASGWYILGKEVAAFEAEFATYIGVGHAVGVANGTDALALALRGLGIGPGDAVATVSHTAVATVAAIEMAGATPVLIDIEEDFFTLDPDEFERAVAARPAGSPIRAVIPVHLYGQPADLDSILAVADQHGIAVIEDCAQAHGAMLNGRRLGSFGVASAYSLYPTKNLAALGDGGIVTTPDAELAARIAALRQYGWRNRYVSDFAGVNSRLDELQAALLRVRLRHLDEDNQRRQTVAAIYDSGLAQCKGQGLTLPARRPGSSHVFHQYVVRTEDRDGLQQRLLADGIGTNVHYPLPVHLQPAYRDRIATGPGGLPRSERAARSVLSLPMFAQLTDEQANEVCLAVRRRVA
ncbi:MAG: DegT/DnrJ/EryC1/StrS family aminotransferase [Lautropia sp.]|nr:DegT/DnrJ/EryC1/StrS family aminotransferase [Lautropia sp.]